MTPERWDKVKEVFAAALRRAPTERTAFLRSACGEDESLRSEVISLLSAHEKDGSFIDSPAAGSAEVPGPFHEFQTGQRIGHYQVLSTLGRGGMGEVYLARDARLDRNVAIKILPAGLATNRDRMRRFVQEAKAAAALNHPNIAHIYEIDESAGTHFIAMEFIDGETLRVKIHRLKAPLSQLLKYLCQVAEGLGKAHAVGTVRRDLKPDNIMITRDDYAKILDFGLAKLIGPSFRGGLPPAFSRDQAGSSPPLNESEEVATAIMPPPSIPGMIMGTIGYMSPEQAQGRVNEIDHRSDIFSFGCLLFEAATGRRAFEGKDAIDSLHKIVYSPAPQLRDLNPNAPDRLQDITSRCLAKEPDERYQSIKEVAIELSELQGELKESTAEHSPVTITLPAVAASGVIRTDEGFWIAVLPFKSGSADLEVTNLADALSEEILTGLSRFSYLRVIARSSTLRYAAASFDVRTIGRELGASYIIEGTLRHAGPTLRLAVQLVDTNSGAHLWAETYDRTFDRDHIFAIQDNLVTTVVSTIADHYGVVPHLIAEALRDRPPAQLTLYETLMRAVNYTVSFTPEAHAETRANVERAVEQAPNHADLVAMLSSLYADEYKFGMNPRPDSLERALPLAPRAVDIAPSNAFVQMVLAQTLFLSQEFEPFRIAAERAINLNPMDGGIVGYMGNLIAFAGDWERGCTLVERATQMNPHFPGWYWSAVFYRGYLKGDYAAALSVALKMKQPGFFLSPLVLAAVYGQLGERPAAERAVSELLALRPDFATLGRDELARWYLPDLVEKLVEGLRKAGLDLRSGQGNVPPYPAKTGVGR